MMMMIMMMMMLNICLSYSRGVFREGPNRRPPLNSANIRPNADCLA